jgi:transcriptional regulator with XRE-family HTH domain
MNMTSKKLDEVKAKFKAIAAPLGEKEAIQGDAFMLMASYLSEIERLQHEQELNRGELAKKINVSSSYLTQVFRGNKPLNFETIAKINKALNIRFQVTAVPMQEAAFHAAVNQKTALIVNGIFQKNSGSHSFTAKVGTLSNNIKVAS